MQCSSVQCNAMQCHAEYCELVRALTNASCPWQPHCEYIPGIFHPSAPSTQSILCESILSLEWSVDQIPIQLQFYCALFRSVGLGFYAQDTTQYQSQFIRKVQEKYYQVPGRFLSVCLLLQVHQRTFWGCDLSYGRRGHSSKMSCLEPVGSPHSRSEQQILGSLHPFYIRFTKHVCRKVL